MVNAKRYKRQARTFTQPCQCSGTETRVAQVCKHQVLRKCGAFLVWSFVLIDALNPILARPKLLQRTGNVLKFSEHTSELLELVFALSSPSSRGHILSM